MNRDKLLGLALVLCSAALVLYAITWAVLP